MTATITDVDAATLETAALAELNPLLEAFGAPPLSQMPDGQPGRADCCSLWRAFEHLGWGDYFVTDGALEVDPKIAHRVVAIWGTRTTNQNPRFLCGRLNVILPPALTAYVNAFDARQIPERIAA